MYTGLIYKYTNLCNGKVYVGQTVAPKRRHNRHLKDAAEGSNTHFHRALRKYGIENFEYTVLFETASPTKERLKIVLDTMEQYFIKKYNSYKDGYNSTIGGDGTLGFKHSKEECKKRSERMLGTHPTEDTLKKMSESRKGRKRTEESRKKQSESISGEKHYNYGKHLGEETKKKVSEARKKSGKPVTIGEITYINMKTAAKALGVCEKTLRKRLKYNYYV